MHSHHGKGLCITLQQGLAVWCQSHDVETVVNIHHVAGDCRGQGGHQEGSNVADLLQGTTAAAEHNSDWSATPHYRKEHQMLAQCMEQPPQVPWAHASEQGFDGQRLPSAAHHDAMACCISDVVEMTLDAIIPELYTISG